MYELGFHLLVHVIVECWLKAFWDILITFLTHNIIPKEGVVIVVDDKNRENEGDLIVIATCTIPQVINFMIWYGRGLVCIVITS